MILDILHERLRDVIAIASIRSILRSGAVCIIRDAFQKHVARAVYDELNKSEAWQPYERSVEKFFAYHHHNLYDQAAFGPALKKCQEIFDSAETKTLLADLSGVDTSGDLHFGASLYLPGDYSLPHTDAHHKRTVAFVWHLAEGWDQRWGGHLFWCSPPTFIGPSFNTLVLFQVTEHSWHFVTPVNAYARARRFAVNGWWKSQSEPARQESVGELAPRDTGIFSAGEKRP